MLWMKEFYSIFIKNDSFQPAYVIAILVCATYLVSSTVYLYLSTSIFINKNTSKILYLVFYPALLNIVLNLIFIPIYGFKAAVYTTIFTYWLVFPLPFLFPSFKQMMREMIGTRKIMLEGLLINIIVLITAYSLYDANYVLKIIVIIFILIIFSFYYRKIKNYQ